MLKANPYTPTAALYRSLLAHSPRLAELSEVQKWLESKYSPPEPSLLTEEFARMDLKQKKRQGQTTRTGYVHTLDLDTTNRTGDSGVLNADDTEEENALINLLFHQVRAGKIEEAAASCEKAARPWRAAFLRGMYLLDWPGLEALDEPSTELKADEARWSGNRRWLLWRQTCKRAALSVSYVHKFLFPPAETFSV
jgi:nuclear pore complex protein Nup107